MRFNIRTVHNAADYRNHNGFLQYETKTIKENGVKMMNLSYKCEIKLLLLKIDQF